MIGFQHLNSPRHNINYADSMAKAKADSAPGSALGGHHGSMHAGGSIGENLNSYSIPMLNMFLQTLQPPAQNCRCVKIANKQGKKVFKSYCLPMLSLLCVEHMVPEALQELPICFDFRAE